LHDSIPLHTPTQCIIFLERETFIETAIGNLINSASGTDEVLVTERPNNKKYISASAKKTS
jgi:hypothetical protein